MAQVIPRSARPACHYNEVLLYLIASGISTGFPASPQNPTTGPSIIRPSSLIPLISFVQPPPIATQKNANFAPLTPFFSFSFFLPCIYPNEHRKRGTTAPRCPQSAPLNDQVALEEWELGRSRET